MKIRLARACPLGADAYPDKQGPTWSCGTCSKTVYDLTQMGPERAATLIREKARRDSVCVRFASDGHGNAVFSAARAVAAAGLMAAGPAMADGGDLPIRDLTTQGARSADHHLRTALNEALSHGRSGDDTLHSPPPDPYVFEMGVYVDVDPVPAPPTPADDDADAVDTEAD